MALGGQSGDHAKALAYCDVSSATGGATLGELAEWDAEFVAAEGITRSIICWAFCVMSLALRNGN